MGPLSTFRGIDVRYPPQMEGSKCCARCKRTKPMTDYDCKAVVKSGRGSRCSECRLIRNKSGPSKEAYVRTETLKRIGRALASLDDKGLAEAMRRTLQESKRRRISREHMDGAINSLSGD